MDSIGATVYTLSSEGASKYTPGVSAYTGTSGCTAASVHGVSTLPERLQWILDHRRRPDGRKWVHTALSAAAKLSKNHIGQMLKGRVTKPDTETLTDIARVAGVSAAWLITGKGSPDDDDDAIGPTRSDDVRPVFANLENWDAVVANDRAEHPDITDDESIRGGRIAAFAVQNRPAVPGDLWRAVLMIRDVNDPAAIARRFNEHQARVQQEIAAAADNARWEREQLDKKLARNKP